MRVGLIQLTTGDQIDQAVEQTCQFIREAAKGGAKFVTTPETTHLMEMNRKQVLAKTFSQENDPGLKSFCVLAKELGIWLHIGSIAIKVAADRLANRSFLIAPNGEITAWYDKIHLFDVTLGNGEQYRESALYQAGEKLVVAGAGTVPVGLSVCYDLRFPALYRALAHAGAKVLLVPAAFTQPTGAAHWHALLRARAIENGCFVLAAAQTGMHATGRKTYGHSLAIDPWGTILADAGTEPGITMVDLDLTQVDTVRSKVPSLTHDRGFIVESSLIK